MPTVLRIGPYRFHFYSDECKFWLDSIRLARNKRVPPHVVRAIEKLVFRHCDFLKEKYDEFHNN